MIFSINAEKESAVSEASFSLSIEMEDVFGRIQKRFRPKDVGV
jgi:hypothetical protein